MARGNSIPGQVADERHWARSAIRAVVDGVTREDIRLFLDALEELGRYAIIGGGWRRAVSAIAKLPPVSDQFRAKVMVVWMSGDSFRLTVGDDLILLDFLRLLLPPYAGPDLRLYRGESAHNRRHSTYGLSWTDEMTVAQQFAENHCSDYQGGTLVLEADVPASAIICSPAEANIAQPHMAHQVRVEREYLVDRRRLRSVRVIERHLGQ